IKLPVRVHQTGNFLLRQSRVAANEGQVESNAQTGIFASQGDSFRERRFVGHEAGSSENSLAVGANDGAIDGGGAAEIVRVHDQTAGRSASRPGYGVSHSKRASPVFCHVP